MIGAIPFDTWPAFPLLVGCGIICLFMAHFMSHSATAALLVPILIVVGVNCADNLAPLGGVTALLVAVAFASSLGIIGLILVYVMMFALAKLNFFGTPTPKSEPAKAAVVEAPAATLDTTVALGADSSATLQVIDSSAAAIADSTAK